MVYKKWNIKVLTHGFEKNSFSFRDASDFKGLKSQNGQSFIKSPEYRKLSEKCINMPLEELEAAQEKILKEIPSLAVSQELDQIHREKYVTKSRTRTLYRIKENVKKIISKLSNKLFGNKLKQLPPAQENIIKSNTDLNEQNNFKSSLSSNGEYRKLQEEYVQRYNDKKQENEQLKYEASKDIDDMDR